MLRPAYLAGNGILTSPVALSASCHFSRQWRGAWRSTSSRW